MYGKRHRLRTARLNGFTRFQVKAMELNRRLASWLDAGKPLDNRHFCQLRLDWQAQAARQRLEAVGLQLPPQDYIKPGTLAEARVSLTEAQRQAARSPIR